VPCSPARRSIAFSVLFSDWSLEVSQPSGSSAHVHAGRGRLCCHAALLRLLRTVDVPIRGARWLNEPSLGADSETDRYSLRPQATGSLYL
jgi:hypothetical protein